MKKVFENPEMNISLFESENVLTVSGGNNLTNATNTLGGTDIGAAAKDITAVDFNSIQFGL